MKSRFADLEIVASMDMSSGAKNIIQNPGEENNYLI